jgi:hypothetical protein
MFDIQVRADLVCEYAVGVDRVLPNAMSIRCQRRNCFGNALRTSVPSMHGQRPPAIRLWRVSGSAFVFEGDFSQRG